MSSLLFSFHSHEHLPTIRHYHLTTRVFRWQFTWLLCCQDKPFLLAMMESFISSKHCCVTSCSECNRFQHSRKKAHSICSDFKVNYFDHNFLLKSFQMLFLFLISINETLLLQPDWSMVPWEYLVIHSSFLSLALLWLYTFSLSSLIHSLPT